MKELILKLSEFERIKIISDKDLDFENISLLCNKLKVYFCDKIDVLIGKETADEIFEPFITCLKKSIEGKLRLHESLTQNLGIMQNEYYQNKPGFFQVPTPNSSSTYWVGFNYDLFSSFGDGITPVTTWLYNDKDNNIILEVTKDYRWHFMQLEDAPEKSEFIAYEDFMKDYKPLIHRTIPRDIAVKWLKDVMKIHKSLFISEENYQFFCKKFLSI